MPKIIFHWCSYIINAGVRLPVDHGLLEIRKNTVVTMQLASYMHDISETKYKLFIVCTVNSNIIAYVSSMNYLWVLITIF